jgi:hypothetical protein
MIQFVTKNFGYIAIILVALLVSTGNGLKTLFDLSEDKNDIKDPLKDNHTILDDTQAAMLASRLEEAMNTAFYTDFDTILEVFTKLKTQSDFNKVYNAFGERQYSQVVGNIGGPWDSNKDLITWLESELNQNQRQTLVNRFPHLNII